MNEELATIYLPLPGEDEQENPLPYQAFVRGDTFEEIVLTLSEPVTSLKAQIRPDTIGAPVMEWNTADATASLSGDGKVITLAAKTPEVTSKIRGGKYYGDIKVVFDDNTTKTILNLVLEVKEGYTK